MFQKLTRRLDKFQQSHHLSAFVYAVIKKYGEDEAGYQAALLTYYGFLSLFPLLLVVSTLTSMSHNPHLHKTVVDSLTTYFPVLGSTLAEHINTLHKSGIALVIGILFTLYGARGVADAFRHGVNRLWFVPRQKLDSFPHSVAKSLALIIVGGLGLLLAAVVGGLAAAAGHHGIGFRVLTVAVNLLILFWLFTFLLKISLARPVHLKDIRQGAATAAIGLLILQSLGGYLLTRELKSLDALYSYFAIALGLLFWIYLQTQVIYYSVEITVVHTQKLWPRSFGGQLTAADKKAYARLATKEQMVPEEHISAEFQEE